MLEMLERTVGKQNDERGERIVELESTIETMSDSLTTQNETIAKQTETIEELQKKVTEVEKTSLIATTEPLREQIIALEKISDEEAKKESMEELSSFNKEQLEQILAKLKRVVKISTKTSKSRDIPFLGDSIEQHEDQDALIDKLTPEQLAAGLVPDLKQYLKKEELSVNNLPIDIKSVEDGVPFIN